MLNFTTRVKLRFQDVYTIWAFEKTFDNHLICGVVEQVKCSDNYFEVTYPVKIWNKNEMTAIVNRFNKYAKLFEKANYGTIEIVSK